MLYNFTSVLGCIFYKAKSWRNFVADRPKQTEAFHNLLIQYHAYSCKLEALIDHYIQTYSLPQSNGFRLERPKDPDDLLGLSLSLGEVQLEEEDNEDWMTRKNAPTCCYGKIKRRCVHFPTLQNSLTINAFQ
jgi:hypothetical protein